MIGFTVGETVFSSMMQSISSQTEAANQKISQAEFQEWHNGYLFDALVGLRYGQSFCNQFDITDNILFYERDNDFAHRYITANYIFNTK